MKNCVDNVDNVDKRCADVPDATRNVEENQGLSKYKTLCVRSYVDNNVHKKFHTPVCRFVCISVWIMWISYFPRSFSPILTTSPAPMVINKSPCTHFSSKNVSISSKDGK